MKILSAAEIRDWDQYTIREEPVTSINLMERAAWQCVDWLEKNGYASRPFAVYCGKGNNGGDGLAIARMLRAKGNTVSVHILEFGHKGTPDFQLNLERLHQAHTTDIHFIQGPDQVQSPEPGTVIIDALLGSGLNRPLVDVTALLVERLNASGCEIIAVDIPSGLFTDRSSKENVAIRAAHTLSFQCYKPAFLVAENAPFIGDVHILNIGLHPGFYRSLVSTYEMTDTDTLRAIYKPRNRFAHKGNFGHAALLAGSRGMIGAAVLAARACMRSGAGKLTCFVPKCGYEIMQTCVPEAMAMVSGSDDHLEGFHPTVSFSAVALGPGIGLVPSHKSLLSQVFAVTDRPMVIDADALTILSENPGLVEKIPPNSILTPHPGEFDRLFGQTDNDFDRIALATQKAKQSGLVLVLKGHHTLIATPGGKGFFNSTGNAGMATGGSGDILTGILTGLLAQGYEPVMAAILGVYLHGLAGDLALETQSEESFLAGDIPEWLGQAFKSMA